MNRVAEYYDVACEYLSLSVSGRFLVATHFGLLGDRVLAYADGDEMDRLVFVAVAKKKMLPEFKKMVQAFKASKDYEARHYPR